MPGETISSANTNSFADPSVENSASRVAPGPSVWLVAIVLAISLAVVYGRALDAPFVFDDHDTLTRNASIRSLWPLIGTSEHRGPLNPVRDLPTSARPLVNFSFALNYYFAGLDLVAFHVVNVVIHFLSAMLLWLIVRQTLLLPRFGNRFVSGAGWLGFAVSLLWSVHPLQTEAVEYITQRTELMMAFFYLATIYCSLRYWSDIPLPPREGKGEGFSSSFSFHRTLWLTLAILACLCGMLSKEVMVSAPIIILLFERTFVTGSFARSLRQSWPLYVGLAFTWIPLIILSTDRPRSYSSGFHLCENIWVWWFTQCKTVLMYLKLAVWPWPLRSAYELPHVKTFISFCVYVIPVLLLALLTLALVKRNNPVGFLLFFVAAILAPTSVVPIMTEMAAERRMYLPLAAILTLLVAGVYLFAKRQHQLSVAAGESSPDSKTPRNTGFALMAILAVLFGFLSSQRLSDYYNETDMWQQVAESQPQNHMAHYNLGIIYNEQGRQEESFAELQAAVAANPSFPDARSAYGFALMYAGRMPEAIESIKIALELEPEYVPALNNMGIALSKLNRHTEAVDYLQRAVHIDPNHADAHHNLGMALLQLGRTAEAIEELQAAHQLAPGDADYLNDLNAARGK
jgi:protein O-mannosyl-transferase